MKVNVPTLKLGSDVCVCVFFYGGGGGGGGGNLPLVEFIGTCRRSGFTFRDFHSKAACKFYILFPVRKLVFCFYRSLL